MIAERPKRSRRILHDDYLELVRVFPLRVLRSDAEHDEAVRIHGRLVGRRSPRPTAGEREYASALARFIQDYDAVLPAGRATPAERLRVVLAQSGTTPKQLRDILGTSQPLVSMLLSGRRHLTVAYIRKLSDHFKLDAGYFI